MYNKPTKNHTSLYSLHIPLFILLMLLVVGTGSVVSLASKYFSRETAVLADSDEEEEDSDSHENDDENDSEDENDSNSDGDENENEDENETDDENEVDTDKTIQIISTVNNPDGTVTKTIKETDEDGDVEMKAITYSATGRVIKEVELNADGTPKLDDEDDNENEDENDVEDQDEDEVETKFEFSGVTGLDQAQKTLILENIAQQLKDSNIQESGVGKWELEAETEDGQLEYKLEGEKTEKLFGIINVNIPTEFKFEAETGNMTGEQALSFFYKVLDLLSF